MNANQPTVSSGNRTLSSARAVPRDEFYTQRCDIENELSNYKDRFRGKVVLCNCDDPYESNFFKHFAASFNHLELRKLIAISYQGSPIADRELPFDGTEDDGTSYVRPKAIAIAIEEVRDINNDGATNLDDVRRFLEQNPHKITRLTGRGDFRSAECVGYLKQADIVVTNPPFSLFREYVAQLMAHERQFLIIGSQSAITYKEVFKLIRENKMWLGCDNGGTKWFQVPDDYDIQTESRKKLENGIKYFSMGSIMWFTNIDHEGRHKVLKLYKPYNTSEYPKYDNYDAINVDRVADIPVDFGGVMGVPITFLAKYNPAQFEIVGLAAGNIRGLAGIPTTSGKDGPYMGGRLKYGRIFIRHRNPA